MIYLSVHRVIKHDQIVTISSLRVFVNEQILIDGDDWQISVMTSVINSLILEYFDVLDIESSS